MVAPNSDRKLVTILVADFVGFSRRMANDEEATAQLLKAHRALTDGIIENHGGRIFNTAGDSLLAEFVSPVEAVRSAVEIQAAIATHNESFSEAERLPLRIGIHLGDVLIRGTDLIGDAVNVASRLQSVAPVGGINISAAIYDLVEAKLKIEFQCIGPQSLRNIPKPVIVYRVTEKHKLAVDKNHRGALFNYLLRSSHILVIFLFFSIVSILSITAVIYVNSRSNFPVAGHWVNGTWYGLLSNEPVTTPIFCVEPDPRCRTMIVQGVGGDGLFRAQWGIAGRTLPPAEVVVSGSSLKVSTASSSTATLERRDSGLLVGEMIFPDGSRRGITMRRAEN